MPTQGTPAFANGARVQFAYEIAVATPSPQMISKNKFGTVVSHYLQPWDQSREVAPVRSYTIQVNINGTRVEVAPVPEHALVAASDR